MRKGSEFLGKTVIAFDTGKKIERIRDLIFDQETHQLLGLLVDDGGLFHSARVIPFSAIQAVGANAAIIRSKSAIMKAKTDPKIRVILRHNNVLRGTKIMTVSGRDLGTMTDLFIDEHTGRVEGYEVSGGFFADAYTGRSFVPAPETLHIGEDIAFVPVSVAEMMEEQVGGFKETLQMTGDQLQSTSGTARRQLEAVTAATSTKLQETLDATGKQLQAWNRAAIASITNAVIDPSEQKAYVIGKTAAHEVVTATGVHIVAAGQPITEAIASLAEDLGELDQLYRATGGRLSEEVNERIQTATDLTRQRLQEVVVATQAHLQDSTDIAHSKLQDATRSTAASITNAIVDPAEQKALVLNRTVEKDVLLPDGTILVTPHQPITYAMAETAEQQGILNQLYRAAGGSLTEDLSRSASNLMASQITQQALGRRVQQMVRTPDGIIIAAPGQIVTPSVIERAQTHGQAAALLAAVGLHPSDVAYSRVRQELSATGDTFREGAIHLQANAQTLWNTLQKQFEQLSYQTRQAWESRRIKGALGRPVNRIILDQQDNIILGVGEIITHRAIEQARQANSLDILLSSVQERIAQTSTTAPYTAVPTPFVQPVLPQSAYTQDTSPVVYSGSKS